MFGKNKTLPPVKGSGEFLKVVEGSPFMTIQGEGPFSGHPAIFIRLHGCNLACTFCDTEFSSPTDKEVSVSDLVETVKLIKRAYPLVGLVVLTGGEPVRQPLDKLIPRLSQLGFLVQIETAGTLWQDVLKLTRIVVSPKTAHIHPEIAKNATAYKYIIRKDDLFDMEDGLPMTSTQVERGEVVRLARPQEGKPVYVSPCDEYNPLKNRLNVEACSYRAKMYGYIVNLQIHKILGEL